MKKERPLVRYEKLSKEDLVDYCRVYWERIHNDEMLFNDIYKDIENLKEENKKLKEELEKLNLHIEAKDEAYMKLLKDYEKIKDDREYMKEKLENDLGKMLFYVNQNF